MDERREFVSLARQDGSNRRALCVRFGISPPTAYKWLKRAALGEEYDDRSRRPHQSPLRSSAAVEDLVLHIRDSHPAWGARKIQRCLLRDGAQTPAASTIHAILRRTGRIGPVEHAAAHGRFEKASPNLLWQMDFKGRVPLSRGGYCHPLTIVDDHSRYAICLSACANEQAVTVKERLEATFQRYGLPEAFLVDNGSPWGEGTGRRWTSLAVWLLKLGVDVLHSRPYHPQSRGKNERFHRTLKAGVFAFQRFAELRTVQLAFDRWRTVYNMERPHQALDQNVPASRYRPSSRQMPTRVPEVEYAATDIIRKVPTTKDYISFKGKFLKVPEAFRGEYVALRPTTKDGSYGIYFGARQIASIDLASVPKGVSYVSEHL